MTQQNNRTVWVGGMGRAPEKVEQLLPPVESTYGSQQELVGPLSVEVTAEYRDDLAEHVATGESIKVRIELGGMVLSGRLTVKPVAK